MSTSIAPRKPHHALSKLNTDCSSLNPPHPNDQTPSPSSTRSGTFARLRLGANGMRRSKSTKSLGRIQSQGAMSIYSDATTVAEATPPLPTSASELTLAHSVASSSKSIKEDSPISLARSFMHRSSRILLKKKTSKSSLNSRTLEWIGDTRDTNPENLFARRAAKHGRAEFDNLKHRISQPFNFQHLAHTVSDGTSNGAAKLSTHRASKPSGELKGINVHDLPVPMSAIEHTTNPARSPDFQLRPSRSMDSFKRISRSSFSTPHPPMIVPPPRRSSRRPTPLTVPHTRKLEQESPTLPDFMHSGRRGSAGSRTVSPKSPLSISTGADDSPLSMMGIAQAVTTPDESAYVMTGELTTPLADVPEEEDMCLQNRSSPPTTTNRHRESKSRIFRSGSDPVLPENAQQTEEIPRASKRVSGHITNGFFLDLDWDQDIDYCYDQLEAEGVEGEFENEPGSPLSDGGVLYMRESRGGNRLSGNGVPLHLRRVSTQAREEGLGMRFPPSYQDCTTGFNASRNIGSRGCLAPDNSKSTLPLFTPDMTGDLHATYSPRSSFSQMSRGGSSRVVSSISSKRTSGLVPNEHSSTISVPDLVTSSRRKSSSTKRSSIQSQVDGPNTEAYDGSSIPNEALPVPQNKGGKPGDTLDVSRIPLRKRSFSDSASKILNSPVPNTAAHSHARSASHAVGNKSPKTAYTLFPPLDRIGATSAKA